MTYYVPLKGSKVCLKVFLEEWMEEGEYHIIIKPIKYKKHDKA